MLSLPPNLVKIEPFSDALFLGIFQRQLPGEKCIHFSTARYDVASPCRHNGFKPLLLRDQAQAVTFGGIEDEQHHKSGGTTARGRNPKDDTSRTA